jgi:hypothetical protein
VPDSENLASGWWVGLSGDQFDLEALRESVRGDEIEIARWDEAYFLRSTDFESLAESAAVERRGNEIVRVLNGAALVHFGNHRAVGVDRVVLVNEDGSKKWFVQLNAGIQVRSRVGATVSSAGGVPEQPPPPSDVEVFLRLGLQREDVERALRIFGRPDVDWRDLYFVFEIVEGSVGGRMYDEGWVTRTEAERFTRTANSPTALSDEARHGQERTQPPPNPMTFEEANRRGVLLRDLGVAAWDH